MNTPRKVNSSGIIEGVQLVPEGTTYKVDGSGRIIIPAYMKAKFGIDNGDIVDYFTAYVNGDWFLCARKHKEVNDK